MCFFFAFTAVVKPQNGRPPPLSVGCSFSALVDEMKKSREAKRKRKEKKEKEEEEEEEEEEETLSGRR